MLTTDDLLSFRSVSEAQISPDGHRVAFTVGAALAGPHAEPKGSRIWIVGAEGENPRPLTQGPGRDNSPAWSPDGRTLAFLSDRAERGTMRLYLLPFDTSSAGGGEAVALDTPPGPVKRFAWSPDGRQIAFVRADRGDDQEGGGDGPKGAPVVVDEGARYDRPWIIDLAGRESRPATEAAVHTWELAWAPDGAALVLVVSDEPTASSWYRCRLVRLDLAGGELTTLHLPPAGRQVARPAPSPDGALVAFVSCGWSDPGMSGGDLWVVPAAGGEARNLTPGAPFSVNSAVWRDGGTSIIADAFDDNQTGLYAIAADGGVPRRLWRGEDFFGFAPLRVVEVGGEALLAVARDNAREPGDVWIGRAGEERVDWRRLTELHPGAAERLHAGWEEVRWSSVDGLEIGGLLMRPVGGDGDAGPAPLVVIVHGGPTAMASARFSSRGLGAIAPFLAERGIAVLMPNYRGSNGRGVAFAEANHGDLGGGDFADINAGVEHLVAAGVADPERLGIAGWSYGGYMAMWAVGQTPRFKAAVAGAGIANWISMHGTSILGEFDHIFIGPDPYDTGGPYADRSPLFWAKAVRAPVLILHGEADRDVPPGQSYEFFRALKEAGGETQLVLYPGAGHGPHEPAHTRDIIERSVAWLADRLVPVGG